MPLLQNISNPVVKSEYVKTVSELLKIKEDALLETLNRYKIKNLPYTPEIIENKNIPLAEKILLLACIKEPSIFKTILLYDTEELFEGLNIASIFEVLIQMLRNNEPIDVSSVMLNLGEEDKRLLSSILLEEINWKDKINSSRATLKKPIIERKLASLDIKIKNISDQPFNNELNELLQQKHKLQLERINLINMSKKKNTEQ